MSTDKTSKEKTRNGTKRRMGETPTGTKGSKIKKTLTGTERQNVKVDWKNVEFNISRLGQNVEK